MGSALKLYKNNKKALFVSLINNLVFYFSYYKRDGVTIKVSLESTMKILRSNLLVCISMVQLKCILLSGTNKVILVSCYE